MRCDAVCAVWYMDMRRLLAAHDDGAHVNDAIND
jgi:hypothetical protein